MRWWVGLTGPPPPPFASDAVKELVPVRQIRVVVLVIAAIAAITVAGVSWLSPASTHHRASQRNPATSTAVAADPLTSSIARTQEHLRTVPRDWEAWATLGLNYVEQAKVTVDPTYYPKADSALARSLQLEAGDNFVAMAGDHNYVFTHVSKKPRARIRAKAPAHVRSLADAPPLK